MDEPHPSSAREIEDAKKILARRNRFLVLLGLLPVNLIADLMLDYASIAHHLEIFTFLTIFGLMLLAMISWAFSKCPRCTKTLFSTSAQWNPRREKCANCGLKFK